MKYCPAQIGAVNRAGLTEQFRVAGTPAFCGGNGSAYPGMVKTCVAVPVAVAFWFSCTVLAPQVPPMINVPAATFGPETTALLVIKVILQPEIVIKGVPAVVVTVNGTLVLGGTLTAVKVPSPTAVCPAGEVKLVRHCAVASEPYHSIPAIRQERRKIMRFMAMDVGRFGCVR